MNYTGIAAAEELDALNSADDFAPVTEVDTVALDATYDAIAAAQALVARLTGLREHLEQGGDVVTAKGLALDVHLMLDTVGSIIGAKVAL